MNATTYIIGGVASDPKIEGYGNPKEIISILPFLVASDPKIEGYGN